MPQNESDRIFQEPPQEEYKISEESWAGLNKKNLEDNSDLLAYWLNNETHIEDELKNLLMAIHDRVTAKKALDMLKTHIFDELVSSDVLNYGTQTGIIEDMIHAMDYLDEHGYQYEVNVSKEAGIRAKISAIWQATFGRFIAR